MYPKGNVFVLTYSCRIYKVVSARIFSMSHSIQAAEHKYQFQPRSQFHIYPSQNDSNWIVVEGLTKAFSCMGCRMYFGPPEIFHLIHTVRLFHCFQFIISVEYQYCTSVLIVVTFCVDHSRRLSLPLLPMLQLHQLHQLQLLPLYWTLKICLA